MTQTQVFGVLFLQSCQSTSLSCVFTKHAVCLAVREKDNEGGKIQKGKASAGIQKHTEMCVCVQAEPLAQ